MLKYSELFILTFIMYIMKAFIIFRTTYCKYIHTYIFTQCYKNAVSVQKYLYNSKAKF